jgi:hypothetical protein
MTTAAGRWVDPHIGPPIGVFAEAKRLEDGPALYKKFRDRKDGCIESW